MRRWVVDWIARLWQHQDGEPVERLTWEGRNAVDGQGPFPGVPDAEHDGERCREDAGAQGEGTCRSSVRMSQRATRSSSPSRSHAATASCARRTCRPSARRPRSAPRAWERRCSHTRLYGQVPGGQAEYLRVPQAQYGPITVPAGPPDDMFVYLSDVLPTSWQAVEYAAVPKGGTLLVLGLGPIGDMSCRIALHQGVGRVIGVDPVAERRDRAMARGVEVLDLDDQDTLVARIRDMTGGRGPDSVIDAVGMEAHGSPIAKAMQQMTGILPDAWAAKLMENAGIDRLAALNLAIEAVRRGGTISIIGVYGGMTDPMPMMTLFDKQIQLRMGQANVHRWVDDILPLLTAADPLGVASFASHRLPLTDAPAAYQQFQEKKDGMIKVLLQP